MAVLTMALLTQVLSCTGSKMSLSMRDADQTTGVK